MSRFTCLRFRENDWLPRLVVGGPSHCISLSGSQKVCRPSEEDSLIAADVVQHASAPTARILAPPVFAGG